MAGLKAGFSYLSPPAEQLRNHPALMHSVLGTLSSEHGAAQAPPPEDYFLATKSN